MVSHSQKNSTKNVTLHFFCKMSWNRFLSFSWAQAVINQIKPFAGISPITTAESSNPAEACLRYAKYLLLLLPITGLSKRYRRKQQPKVLPANSQTHSSLKTPGLSSLLTNTLSEQLQCSQTLVPLRKKEADKPAMGCFP